MAQATMAHQTKLRGEEYAREVTARQIEAAQRIGQAAVHLNYAATMGVLGAAEAAVGEIADQAVGRSELMVGPLLRAGYLLFGMPPLRKRLEPRFIVVRAWSVSIYPDAEAMARPDGAELVIATANLSGRPTVSTLPSGRVVIELQTLDMSVLVFAVFAPGIAADSPVAPLLPAAQLDEDHRAWVAAFQAAGQRVETMRDGDSGAGEAAELETLRAPSAPRARRVIVTVLEARRLLVADQNTGKSDPFVAVTPQLASGTQLRELTQVTPTVPNSLDPVWNARLEFGGPGCSLSLDSCTSLLLRVRDEDRVAGRTVRSEPLGRAIVALPRPQQPATEWLSLEPDFAMSAVWSQAAGQQCLGAVRVRVEVV